MKEFTKLDRALQGLELALEGGILPGPAASDVRGNIDKLRDWARKRALDGTDIHEWLRRSDNSAKWDRTESPLCWCGWLFRAASMGSRVCREVIHGQARNAVQTAYESELAQYHDMATRALFWGIAKVATPPHLQDAKVALKRCDAALRALGGLLEPLGVVKMNHELCLVLFTRAFSASSANLH